MVIMSLYAQIAEGEQKDEDCKRAGDKFELDKQIKKREPKELHPQTDIGSL